MDNQDFLFYEKLLLNEGLRYIAGVDEVGRGPLAGDVYVTAVIMDLEKIVKGVNDSKKLTEKRRDELYPALLKNALAISRATASAKRIDEINILNATKECMRDAVMSLEIKPDAVLIDAVKLDLPFKTISIVHGDSLSYSIACASVIAKVERDTAMTLLHNEYPEYGFKDNKGYGTKSHIEAILKYGMCPHHRRVYVETAINNYKAKAAAGES
ncbi:MAG: ribonuclease HII [Clostridiales bacterium]|nr:ribonuclease HII [Clostridiales bacterium]